MSRAAPRVGLVLGAGGVSGGAFHAGVLAAIEEVTGWDPREAAIVVGTSAGSVAGTSLRAGLSAADDMARAEGRPMSAQGTQLMRAVGPPSRPPLQRAAPTARHPAEVAAALARAAARPFAAAPWALLASLMPGGSISTEFISGAIAGLFATHWPDRQLWVCSVRQSDGQRVVFGHDTAARPPLPLAVAASCAIPGFYEPVMISGESYIDGGVHSPTNADALVDSVSDLDVVLVSSPMSLAGRRPGGFGSGHVVRSWAGALLDTEALRLRRRGVAVVAFQPTADDVGVMGDNAMDADRRPAVARQAYESTRRRLERGDTRARLAVLYD